MLQQCCFAVANDDKLASQRADGAAVFPTYLVAAPSVVSRNDNCATPHARPFLPYAHPESRRADYIPDRCVIALLPHALSCFFT